MAEVRLAGITHRYKGAAEGEGALRDVDITWKDGGAYALLGPSGCGKTTMLNIISGLLRPSEGRVWFDGVDVTDWPTAQRNIAQVFQFPVLYDSMTVEENMRFPLRNRGVGRQEAQARAHEIAELLDIGHLLKRRARGLPADAKQLVSLSRALVRRDVSAVLFDEPLTVIDPQKKWTLRQVLKRVHSELNHTLIYVTHDQTEALTFADVVVVMNEGRILQVGPPDELFERPTHRFVGHFIGSPGMNFLPCTVHDGVVALAGVDVLRLPDTLPGGGGDPDPATGAGDGPPEAEAEAPPEDETEDVLGVRPDSVRCSPSPSPSGLAATVTEVRDLGAAHLVRLAIDGTTLVAKLPPDREVPTERCWVEFEPGRLQLFRGGRLVAGCRELRSPVEETA